jgi:hypothetical protein
MATIRDDLVALESQFRTERDSGYIPADEQIAARLVELEGVRT